jgi:hypothetical protein
VRRNTADALELKQLHQTVGHSVEDFVIDVIGILELLPHFLDTILPYVGGIPDLLSDLVDLTSEFGFIGKRDGVFSRGLLTPVGPLRLLRLVDGINRTEWVNGHCRAFLPSVEISART